MVASRASGLSSTWFYAVDGLWGIGGKAYTNAVLGDAVTRASAA
ncbi:hypothetical protein ACFPFP_24095 [Bradyrhizobium sp. GCM10023182]|nr:MULTISPECIES: hypothetical protein [Bradyrhizobium]